MNTPGSIKQLLKKMTLEEKTSLLSGSDFWHVQDLPRHGIGKIMVADGPHGLRKMPENVEQLGMDAGAPATCFPAAVTMACSWDPELLARAGKALAEECLAANISVLLGPGLNIKRSPLCGRNFEYYSEDPYLSGKLAAGFVNGLQSEGVGACIKHFAANNQEYYRFVINELIDERSLREIYLTGFEITVKDSRPWTVMGSYNRINEIYSCENKYLLAEILRGEWGFEGLVMTDWGAMSDRPAAVSAGLDLEMPGSGGLNDAIVAEAVRSGTLSESDVDKAAARVIELVQKAEAARRPGFKADLDANHRLASEIAEQSMVLLKNEGLVLPLSETEDIAVIGAMAKEVRYQGTGSSEINPTRLEIAYEELCKTAGRTLPYAAGYKTDKDGADRALMDEAVAAAKRADKVVLFIGLPKLFESEGFDRVDMRIPENQRALAEALASAGRPLIVVLCNGSPAEMPWIDKADGALEAYLGGQAGGSAIARLLYGKANPCGKLAETFPLKLEDNPSYNYFPGSPAQVQYREGLYVGYRYYDSAEKDVLFPFGFGLSYTKFEYSGLKVSKTEISEGEKIVVGCVVTNAGSRAGREIVQLYVHDVESAVYRPEQELKGFVKLSLRPGESKRAEFSLNKRAFAFYDVGMKDWAVESGDFELRIGASSRDIRLKTVINVDSEHKPALSEELKSDLSEYYRPPKSPAIFSDKAFSALYGKAPLPPKPIKPFDKNSPVSDLRCSFFGRAFVKLAIGAAHKRFGDSQDETTWMMTRRSIEQNSLRAIVLNSGGKDINFVMMNGIIDLANGKVFRGLAKTIKGLKLLRAGKSRKYL